MIDNKQIEAKAIKAKAIKVPTSWDDITLKTFYDILDISNDSTIDIYTRECKIISAVTGESLFTIQHLDLQSYTVLSSKLKFLSTPVPQRMPEDTVTLNSTTYIVDKFVKDITAQQYLDYKVRGTENASKNASKNAVSKAQLTAGLISCFLHPKGSAYNDGTYDVDKVIDDIMNFMTVPEVTALSTFFMIQYKALSKALIQYSVRMIKKSREIPKQDKKKILEMMSKLEHSTQHGGFYESLMWCQKLTDALGTLQLN